MATWALERVRLAAGRWEGRLTGPEGAVPPRLSVSWQGAEIAEPQIAPVGKGIWTVAFALPPAVMTDGMQVIAVGPPGGDPLCHDMLAFGDALAGDLAAHLAALETEVAVLKRAFRRHLSGED